MFGALVGHILYGLILGVSYATLDKIWVRLFIQSDPLNREAHGPGLRVLQSLGWGALAGFAGGIVSSPIMLKTGVLTKVAGLDTSFTNLARVVGTPAGQFPDWHDLRIAVSQRVISLWARAWPGDGCLA